MIGAVCSALRCDGHHRQHHREYGRQYPHRLSNRIVLASFVMDFQFCHCLRIISAFYGWPNSLASIPDCHRPCTRLWHCTFSVADRAARVKSKQFGQNSRYDRWRLRSIIPAPESVPPLNSIASHPAEVAGMFGVSFESSGRFSLLALFSSGGGVGGVACC